MTKSIPVSKMVKMDRAKKGREVVKKVMGMVGIRGKRGVKEGLKG